MQSSHAARSRTDKLHEKTGAARTRHPTGSLLSVRFFPLFVAVLGVPQEALRNFGLDEAHTFLEQAQSLEVRENDGRQITRRSRGSFVFLTQCSAPCL